MRSDTTARPVGDDGHARRVIAWLGYDAASSAFAIVVVSAVLPLYFSSVAGATLPSAAAATQVFSVVAGVALLAVSIAAPLLGSWADLTGRHTRILGGVVVVGACVTGALGLVTEGRWVLALVLFGVARIAFEAGDVLYDSLLPVVSRPDDRGAVSAGGYAAGSLGGAFALLLAVVAIWLLPVGTGPRWVFPGVAVWWLVFSIPLLRTVPPPGRRVQRTVGLRDVVRASAAMVVTIAGVRDRRGFIGAYVLCRASITVVIALAALYGRELGFTTPMLLGALVLVQLVGIPFTIAFGRLATVGAGRRGRLAAGIVATLVLLPAAGIGLAVFGPAELVGRAGPAFAATADRLGQGGVNLAAQGSDGARPTQIDPSLVAADDPVPAIEVHGDLTIPYNGRDVAVTYASGPDQGRMQVLVDGNVLVDADGSAVVVNTGASRRRYGNDLSITVEEPGPHDLTIRAAGAPVLLTSIDVLPPRRIAAWWFVGSVLLAAQIVALALGGLVSRWARPWADRLDERGLVLLGLAGYAGVAAWGFGLDTVIEVWCLAWCVAVVQGGTQALLRSWFAAVVPPRRAGEYFGLAAGLVGIASFVPPLLFVASVAMWQSSRPAALGLAVVFVGAIGLVRRTEPPTRQPVVVDGHPPSAAGGRASQEQQADSSPAT